MKSYTTLRNLSSSLAGPSTSDTTFMALMDQLINDGVRFTIGSHEWPFLEKTATIATVASQQAYQLPYDYGQLITAIVTIGTTQYIPIEAPNRTFWNVLNTSTAITSDVPNYFYIFGSTLSMWPTPASTAGTITVTYKKAVRDLSIADYTTGTIVSVANGGTAVVGSGTTWTTPMTGRYIRITNSDTANKGDGFWYPIASVGSATTLTLADPYGGTAIAAGAAAYTIGQMSVIPENYDTLPVWYAVSEFLDTRGEEARAAVYRGKYDSGNMQMLEEFGQKSANPSIDKGLQWGYGPNPNNYLRNVGS